MDDAIDFEEFEDRRADAAASPLVLDLEGYEGPIDVLLALAREQKVDLTRISILALADQYLEFVGRARKLDLEIAADYLVMAAWLAYLKSRLLLPEAGDDEEPSGAEMASALKFHLRRVQAMQDAGLRLMAGPRLGRDVFSRGQPALPREVAKVTYEVSLFRLLKVYGNLRREDRGGSLVIDADDLYSVDAALGRLRRLLGGIPGWQAMANLLPGDLQGGLVWRSAMSSTLAAGLEMTREGSAEIRQDGPFQPIYLRRGRQPVGEGS